ncbi:cytochrome P450 4g1-like isoform X2 [Planococcus citri]|uniref:cytochrome P450 4g1-like isoform X2 n=1 Tax=Planococcus citri TaxID=170843 RepID=UPI0031F7445F
MSISSNFFPFHSSITFYIGLLLILITLVAKYIIKTYRRDPRLVKFAHTIPGPPETSIFGSFGDFVYGEDSLKKAVEYLETYGHVYKLWFGRHLWVGLSNIEDLEVVFMKSEMLAKPEIFHPFHDFWGDGLFTAPVEIWKKNRKKLTPAFGNNRFGRYTHQINDTTRNYIRIIEKHVDGTEFNAWDYLPDLSFDIMTKTMLNVEFDLQNPLATEFRQSMAKGIQIGFERTCYPLFHMNILSEFYHKKKIIALQKNIFRFAKKILNDEIGQIKDEIKLHKENPDKVSINEVPPKSFLTSAYELLNEGYDKKVVYDEIINAISGGTNTTASMLSFFLLAVAIHQDIQTKIYDELYEIFGDSDRDADLDDIKRLSYFDQVLKETLRNRVFPAGTTILISIGAVHFNPEYYSNPWKFDPEHFSPEAVENRPKLAFIPFSVGARNCIGQNFAMLEMKLMLSALLRNFSFHTTTTMDDIKLNMSFVIDSVNGYNMSIKSRVRKPSYL